MTGSKQLRKAIVKEQENMSERLTILALKSQVTCLIAIFSKVTDAVPPDPGTVRLDFTNQKPANLFLLASLLLI
jgi:hypothetical protein